MYFCGYVSVNYMSAALTLPICRGGGWVELLLYNLGVGGSDNMLYNVMWGRGRSKMAIFALYNSYTIGALSKRTRWPIK